MKHIVNTGPQLAQPLDTARMMRGVLTALLPAVLFSCYLFGFDAVTLYLVCGGGAVLAEWAFRKAARRPVTVSDGSALLSGILLAMCLPPGLSPWMAFLGVVFAIGAGKIIFGGLGSNIFNPALAGRAFLSAAFPGHMTSWAAPRGVDALSTATPLGAARFDGVYASYGDLFLGFTGGSLGETSALLLLAGGAWMLLKKLADWRIPLAYLLTVFVLAAFFRFLRPDEFAPPVFHLFSGGLLLGALYMATDPVTSPVTVRGRWLFGLGCGLLTVFIRLFGGMAEGVAYSILFMNALAPLLNRYTSGPVFGQGGRRPSPGAG